MSAEPSESQLGWERQRSRPAAAAAIAAGVLPLLVGILLTPILPLPEDPEAGVSARLLLGADEAPATLLAFAVVSAIAVALLVPALGYLVRVIRARSDRLPAIVRPLLVASALGLAAVIVLERVFLSMAAEGFAATEQTNEAATEALRNSPAATVSLVGLALSVALGVAVVLIALNAMRTGLVSRFMGIVGVIAGVLFAIPQFRDLGLPVQVYWLVALGFLFLGRWPGGRGPAWDRVEAVPWPTAAERAEQQREERASNANREGYGDEEPDGTGDAGDAGGDGDVGDEDHAGRADTPASQRPASRKKRRRGR